MKVRKIKLNLLILNLIYAIISKKILILKKLKFKSDQKPKENNNKYITFGIGTKKMMRV